MTPSQTAEIFTDKAKRLGRTRIGAADDLFAVRWSASEPMAVAIQGLDEDDLDAFLLTLRLFVQDNEPISLRRFCTHTVPELDLTAAEIERVHAIHDSLNAFLDSRLIVPW